MPLAPDAEERAKRIAVVMLQYQLPFKQVCGQRIYGPSRLYPKVHPPRGCEVFVANIPRDVYEDEIIRLFAEIGNLYQIRFMMEFSGMNRGFAYFLYTNEDSAGKAVKQLHGHIMGSVHRLSCYTSWDNSRLYFDGLPKYISPEQAVAILKTLFIDCENIIVIPDPDQHDKNHGAGFVQFPTHRQAAEMRKKLWPTKVSVLGHKLFVEWANPLH